MYFQKKMSSIEFRRTAKEREKFEQKYYKDTPSKKRLAVVNNTSCRMRTNSDDKIISNRNKHDKLFGAHSDSLGRDFFDGSEWAKDARSEYKGYFRFPALYTISPGATAYHFCINFASRHFSKFSSNTTFITILIFGVNEMLTGFDVFSGRLCNLKLISDEFCSICTWAREKGKHVYKPHKLPKLCYEFKHLNRRYHLGFSV